jgi:3-hydroxy-9,10-secoandrosta-1,3,5(10)-triene-9,17-dione monooxygenase
MTVDMEAKGAQRSFSDLGTRDQSEVAAELIRRAEAMRPMLLERQAEAEALSNYAQDVHEVFRDAGFYRMLVPRRYGGLEVGVDTFMRVVTALARGCPSSGWGLCLGASHALQVGSLYDEPTQRELFGDGYFISPATVAPQGKTRRAADGGWVINGTFNYCSGSAYATHYMGHVMDETAEPASGPPRIHLFIAPRSTWTRLDDWKDTLGLKGSASNSIRFQDAVIPEKYMLRDTWFTTLDVSAGTIGETIHANPMYAGPPLSFAMLEIAALAVGIAQGARDAYRELMETKMTAVPPVVPRTQDPTFQRWYGTASATVDAAEALVNTASSQWMQNCREGHFTHEKDLRLVSQATETIDLCWTAMHQVLCRTAGSSVLRSGSRLERAWRDMSMVRSHNGVVSYGERSRLELGQYA